MKIVDVDRPTIEKSDDVIIKVVRDLCLWFRLMELPGN